MAIKGVVRGDFCFMFADCQFPLMLIVNSRFGPPCASDQVHCHNSKPLDPLRAGMQVCRRGIRCISVPVHQLLRLGMAHETGLG